jgi:phage FluMu gp28-like protein
MTDNPIAKIADRFESDAAGFCYAFTNIFVERDGTKQKLYPKQIEFMNKLKKEDQINVVVKCRQSGFSTGIQGKAVHRAYFGKVPEILITSAGQNQSMRVLKKIKGFYESMPDFMRPEFEKYTDTQITLANKTSILSLPANPDTCRGFTGDVFLDEYGVQSRREGDELWEALLPCTAKGYVMTAVSTPKGRNNMFYDLVNPKKDPETGEAIGPQADRIIKVHWQDVPHIAAVIAKFQKSMHPKQFRQEFECEFLDSAESALFSYDFLLDHVVDARENGLRLIDIGQVDFYGDSDVMPEDKIRRDLKGLYPNGIIMGWDIAITDDGSICVVFGIDEKDCWNLIAYKKFPKNTDLSTQVPYVSRLAHFVGAKRLGFDATGGLGLAAWDLLKKTNARNILHPVKFSTQFKMQEYSAMRSKMALEGFKTPDIQEMMDEFVNLNYNPITGRIGSTGNHRQNHDDWPSAFVCAYSARKRGIMQSGFTYI